MESGQFSPGAVKCLFLCYMKGWNLNKIKRDERTLENFMSIASQLSFIFQEKDDKFVLDLCFCRQQLPIIFIDKKAYYGYEVNTDFKSLTCSLTALQYIEARQLLDMGEESLPLLAAILYFDKEVYSSEEAQKLALKFKKLPVNTLRAIALNFTAVIISSSRRLNFPAHQVYTQGGQQYYYRCNRCALRSLQGWTG